MYISLFVKQSQVVCFYSAFLMLAVSVPVNSFLDVARHHISYFLYNLLSFCLLDYLMFLMKSTVTLKGTHNGPSMWMSGLFFRSLILFVMLYVISLINIVSLRNNLSLKSHPFKSYI